MARILGIDFGRKKIGLALSDELLITAQPFMTIEGKDIERSILEIKKISQENEVSKVVLGLPKTLKGEIKNQAKEVQNFARRIKKEIKIPVVFEDERFSTSMIYKILPKRVIKKDKKIIDQASAQIILQSYLDKIKGDKR